MITLKKIKTIGTLFSIVLLLLSGCSDNVSSEEITTNHSKNSVPISQELTLYVEDYIMQGDKYSYAFTGFIGEDTLTFKMPDGYGSVNVFYPAKVGHTFTLKNLDELKFEILEFNREEGYVKLKTVGY
jgi:hypothetical protein